MSVYIVSHPFKFDFAENNPVFVIQNTASDLGGRKLAVRFGISYPDGGSAHTPLMTYDFDADGRVEVGTLILRNYFREAEVPNYDDVFVSRVIGNNTITYGIEFAEVVDGDEQNWRNGTQYQLCNGYVKPYMQVNNFPDWGANFIAKFESRAGIDFFGQDNNAVVKAPVDCEQYVYLRNYGASAATLATTVTLYHKDGTTTVLRGSDHVWFSNPSIPGKSLVRMRTDLAAFGVLGLMAAGVARYVVALGSLTRTYVVVSKPFNGRTFFVKNALNLYDSLWVSSGKRELSTSGDRVVYGGSDEYCIDDYEEVFTARTGLRKSSDLNRLAVCLRKDGNLLVSGEWADVISVVPGSFVLKDESEDLIEVEFQYKVVKRVARPYGGNEEGSGELTSDFVIGAHTVVNNVSFNERDNSNSIEI